MEDDYEDYRDFVDNPPRLIACPPDNATVPNVLGGPSSVYCIQPFTLDSSRQTVAIYGIVSPLFVAMTLITNVLVCIVLVKPTMRTCTNALLVAMAVSDTMTGVLPVPCFLYFYTTGERYLEYVPHSWCFAYFCLTDYLPTIFHTASVWLTVALAAHRYVFVCHPGPAKRLCTMRNVLRLIGIIYFVAVVSQFWRIFEYQYLPVDVLPRDELTSSENGEFYDEHAYEEKHEATQWVVNLTSSSTLVDNQACFYILSPAVSRHENLLFNTYYWFRVVCIHIVPCTSLVVLNSALVGAIRTAQRRRNELLCRRANQEGGVHLLRIENHQAPASSVGDDARRVQGQRGTGVARSRRLPEGSSTTLMLVIVVGVFLLVETPLAVFLVLMIAENTFGASILTTESRDTASLYLNLFTLVSYPVNFFIYWLFHRYDDDCRRKMRNDVNLTCCESSCG